MITVSGVQIAVQKVENEDYISLTNMVADSRRSADVIKNRFCNKVIMEFLGVWEKLYNPNFKVVKFDRFYGQAGLGRFVISDPVSVQSLSSS